MCVWTAQAWTDCMSTLLEKRSKNDPISVVPWTCGRSGLQGVSKGCQRGAPVASNVSQESQKRIQSVAKGAQGIAKRPRGVKIGAQTAIIHRTRYQQMTKNITSLACLALSLSSADFVFGIAFAFGFAFASAATRAKSLVIIIIFRL